ncbi:MBOAT family protein [Sphingomonas sp. ID1715]|uniref:MBOAT family O-acyltransferase n=1 Tax=Sphingomonas sp. ID1715 TaxID=1656898 RepID=UPI00148970E8|nr:MBOAT family protein [Sphingomonas sp. ID1715]NNM76840.1 MBOAT family protein [Sphingomonas sp. ID1715]
MVFNSLTFVVFFLIVVCFHYAPFSWQVKKFNLLIFSYIFYAAWNPPFILLLWASTVVDWWMAKLIYREERPRQRKRLLLVSLALNLGMLSYFKYGAFALKNWQALMGAIGVAYVPPAWDIVLPIGISFYTFVTLSYTLDVYLKRAKPGDSFLDFALFVTYFPHLVAGPIVRPIDLMPQFATPRVASRPLFLWGLALIVLGLFQKVVVADTLLAEVAEDVFGARQPLPPLDAWAGVIAFSGQIFADFAGYSTCAIGVSLCLGFSLPVNFRYPYAAIGFSDFWRRWHISLSTWLRDYLYIPLGGNRGSRWRTYRNLMLTMLLGGLWHGANWTFVVWGGLHGLYLSGERFLRERFGWKGEPRSLVPKLLVALLTYLLVCITWVFFRAPDFAAAGKLLADMAGLRPSAPPIIATVPLALTAITMGAMFTAHWLMRDRELEDVVARRPAWLVGLVVGVMAAAVILAQGEGSAFIYFQF